MQELTLARAPVMLFRTSGDPAAADASMRQVIAGLGHEYARQFYSLDEQVEISLLRERLLAGLSAFFAGLGVLIAVVGLYAALAYAVAQRTREIGIRMALGASMTGVVRMVVRDAVVVTVAGVAVGILGALAAGRFADALLFGLRSSDATTIATAAAIFILIGLLAGLRPALRAAAVDPMTALRTE
jgi:ABC-type antimicrobial peptide transport system permease subunit